MNHQRGEVVMGLILLGALAWGAVLVGAAAFGGEGFSAEYKRKARQQQMKQSAPDQPTEHTGRA